MSEYQRYEFMTIDRPLTGEQLDAVNDLSSHIEASSTHALIEYNWGDFKYDPIKVLHEFFDGFLYWANWGSPQLALRFPHGILPADLIDGYDLDEYVTFTCHTKYDILDIHFNEMESPDVWVDYELGSLIALRDELMEGDLRALYIVWLAASQRVQGGDEVEEDVEITSVLPVPPGLGALTAAQKALAELLQVPQELLNAAAQHSNTGTPPVDDNFVVWVERLPQDRRSDYLVRLAHNEPGLSRRLVKELREVSQGKMRAIPVIGKRVSYATLSTESKAVKARMEREKREQEQQARQRHLQNIHDQQDRYWQQVEQAVTRKSSTGYDEATRLLIELREVADHFAESQKFQARFRPWVQTHLCRPAFIRRLQDHKFTLPES